MTACSRIALIAPVFLIPSQTEKRCLLDVRSHRAGLKIASRFIDSPGGKALPCSLGRGTRSGPRFPTLADGWLARSSRQERAMSDARRQVNP